MKYLFILSALIFTQIAFTQVSQIEKDLNAAEHKLIEMETEFEQLELQLEQQGKRPKDDFEYLQLKSNIKLQKKKVRNIRRAYKSYQRAKRRLQKEQQKLQQAKQNAQQINQNQIDTKTAEPVSNKDAIRQTKKLIRQLNRQRNKLIKQEIKAGRDPMKNQQVKQLDQQILENTDRLKQLELKASVPQQKSSPKVESAVNQPTQPAVETKIEAKKPVPKIGLQTILFAKFSTEVDEKYGKYLNFVADQLIDNPELRLVIDAYTDDSEKNKISKDLSEKMAHNTAQAFVNRGIPPERLIVRAFGSNRPIADNSQFFGQVRNRRVELSFVN